MKKLLSILLCLAMMLTMVACGNSGSDTASEEKENNGAGGFPGFGGLQDADENEDDIKENEEEEKKETSLSDSKNETVRDPMEEDAENEFEIGTNRSGEYKNDFIGLACKVDSDWSLANEDELLALNGFAEDAGIDEYRDAAMFYDMYAYDENGNTISVILEKIDEDILESLDLRENYENRKSFIQESFEGMGFESIEFTDADIFFAGEERIGMYTESEIQGTVMYQGSVSIKCGDYLISITVTTAKDDLVDECFDWFYEV
ncbi:MAG: hypothetical protein E7575_07860 [Ruminococcaceae bacterium]|nr:hypothetical protein [Oscillospiraceae bacterium]